MKIVYVRFGIIPPDEKSYNNLDDFYENGVSVYEALYRNGKYQILLPKMNETTIFTLGQCFNVAQCMSGQLDIHNRLYLIEGEVVGIGSDGEPLLKNCKVIKPIFEKEINQWENVNGQD